MEKHPIEKLAEELGGTIHEVMELPDGSGVATMSMALKNDHWLYGDPKFKGAYEPPPMPFRMGE